MMAPRAKAKAVEVEEVEEVEGGEYDGYLTKDPTDLQERFTDWLQEVVGYDPAAAKSKATAFAEGVRLATALRMKFQASPENQEVLEARRAEIEAAKAGASKPARKTRKPAPVEEPEDDDTDEDEVEEAPKPAPKRRTTARKPAPKAAPVEPEEDDEEPEEAPAPAPKRRTRRKPATAAAPF